MESLERKLGPGLVVAQQGPLSKELREAFKERIGPSLAAVKEGLQREFHPERSKKELELQ